MESYPRENIVTENFNVLLAVLRPPGAWETRKKFLRLDRQVVGILP